MQIQKKTPLIVILGPTANGKTRLGIELAKQFNGEIISADSRQVFRRMDIGTGKDLQEYGDLPYHLIDIAEPGQEYNLFRYAQDFSSAFEKVISRNKLPFLVGGTGMYLDATLQRYALTSAPIDKKLRSELEEKSHEQLIHQLHELSPSLHNETDSIDKDRTIRAIEIALAEKSGSPCVHWPDFEPCVIGLQFPREVTRERISARLSARLEEGMIEEVENLIQDGVSHEALEHYGLEYRFISQHLLGEMNLNDMHQKLRSAIHQFAKQQEKWFRNIEKKGVKIHWLDTQNSLFDQGSKIVSSFLKNI
ncbi:MULTISPECIES: tRNA (adenosine(37)-N6)-dimethylallyltransferase MiaA [unclassified Oleiphilus]|uniref:tRNA (adenosine(37)-N6)-dimethylallyltransferase MiaA n=2 Tax=Oleiphilus TaxID=141450 RepID=UPI0007C280F2|nr:MULTISPECIES: tRNA (adenosine(37)-N6)-dimethylallyltransferase MiaA [unclassified Oleiphilus]KZY63834.1 tRNA (adenosine(37)-N6)-dimethylallyltransferase MiaA [Oleiphilus sp. HI0066]KZY69252.1 tRNA (adenosine(37)-N6)-dimethylallyltransferase MiaA [Oleiphilus sp. HI0067]KZZ61397.1 tRNA (adenosine(37)-N6)-dimethylallyltransferase MiaA [Oleiphilus sp. HI0125]